MNNLETIKNVSRILANRIEKEDIKGACNRVPLILKYYLKKYYGIDINLNFGVIEFEERFSFHMWNSYDGKSIDVTVHNQLISEINSNCLILNKVYIKKNGIILYHSHDKLPQKYLDFIEEMTLNEYKLKALKTRTNEEEKYLSYIQDTLDYDTALIKMNKIDINNHIKTKNHLKAHYKKEMNDTFIYIKKEMYSINKDILNEV